MNKLSAIALIAALFVLVTPDADAEAKSKIRFHDHHDRHEGSDRISCNTARHMVRERGYDPVKIKSCVTPVYSFYAMRNGRAYIFHVDPETRSLWPQ